MPYPYPAKTYLRGPGTQVLVFSAAGPLTSATKTTVFDIPPGHHYVGGVLTGLSNNKALSLVITPYISATQAGTNTGLNYAMVFSGTASEANVLPLAANGGVSGKVFEVMSVGSSIPMNGPICTPYGIAVTVSSSVGTGSWTLDLIVTEV